MASVKERATRVELRESEKESAKPQPLRIIKRSQTVANCEAGRAAERRGRGTSGGSDESKGSPPQGVDRPLTVRKKRQGRRSVIGLSMEEPGGEVGGSVVEDIIRKHSGEWGWVRLRWGERLLMLLGFDDLEEDLDVTPKARLSAARTNSAGAFLKSELYLQSRDIEATRYSVRDNRHSMFSPQPVTRRPHIAKSSPPKIPERRPSKSKNFFLRAIGGRLSDESKSIRRKDSTASKATLVRRLSRSRNPSSSESYTDSIISTDSAYSFDPDSLDITDVSMNSRISSSQEAPHTVPQSLSASPPDVFVLCPQIIITPEISSVDTGSCFLWVAIEVTGTLQRADGLEDREHEYGPRPSNPLISGMLCFSQSLLVLMRLFRTLALWPFTFHAY